MRIALAKLCATFALSGVCILPLANAGESNVTVLPDNGFFPLRLSANGEAVIGQIDTSDISTPQLWSRDRGFVKLTDVAIDAPVRVGALSADGAVVAGQMRDSDDMMPDHLFLWTSGKGFEVLPPFSRYRDERIDAVLGITRDGKTVYFATHQQFANSYGETIRSWSESGGYQTVSLGKQLYGTEIFTVTGDGTAWLATIRSEGGDSILARIVNGAVMKTAALPAGFDQKAGAKLVTNRDGSVVILQMLNSIVTGQTEVSSQVWDGNLKPVALPVPQGCSKARANVADANGAIFGGVSCATSSGDKRVPIRWTSAGDETVAEWFRRSGVALPDWSHVSIYAVSDDGHTVLGEGDTNGKLRNFIARVD